MRHLPDRRMVPGIVVTVLVIAGMIYLAVASGAEAGPLHASGTVEATEVTVASEVAGRVVEVAVEEGEAVQAGDLLLRLDDTVLQVQRRKTAAAGLAAVTAARLQLIVAKAALDTLYEDAPLIRAQAQLDLANARDVLDDAVRLRSYNQPGHRATDETIDATKARLVLAEDSVEQAESAFREVEDKDTSDPERAMRLTALHEARKARDAVKQNLNWYKGSPSTIEQGVLDAKVVIATEQVARAELELRKWQSGPDLATLAQAQATLENAKAQLELAKAQAASDLQVADEQLAKLQVRASMSGTVLSRSLEPGEVVLTGASLMTIGDPETLRITVFVPEDRYGEIRLGDTVEVTVDSFEDVTFEAHVVRIADEAEFTPRNVQTEEGRRTTVFAVEVSVKDPQGLLKPGMPADVVFQPAEP
jgi:HlyD family secretion protein